MTYSKPEIVELGSAIASVQSHGKPLAGRNDSVPRETIPAYEADE
jgi:hypothetical protein